MKKSINILMSLFLFCTPLLKAKTSEETLINNMNDFAFSFYSNSSAENVVFSPYSLFSCLTMAYVGAKEDTGLEMQKALNLTLNKTELTQATNAVKNALYSPSLNIANAIWVQKNLTLKTDYKNALTSGWEIEARELDFYNTINSTNTINSWVARETNDQIEKLFNPGDLDRDTKLVLTNAIYLKAQWQKPFNKANTKKGPFYKNSGEPTQVDMMNQTSLFPYFENEALQLLVMPFKSTDNLALATFFLLPKGDLKELESFLTGDSIEELLASTQNREVSVKIPRFKLKNRIKPEETLQKLGMGKAFARGANFSDITEEARLEITQIIHEAVFACDEAGVIAAAATGIAMGVTCVKPRPKIVFNFVADHPFLFGIIDLNSGLTLFLGKLQNPI